MTEKYEVENIKIKAILKQLGTKIDMALPPGWGFSLMIFDYSTKPGGSMFYISSASRGDMVTAMKEFIKKNGG